MDYILNIQWGVHRTYYLHEVVLCCIMLDVTKKDINASFHWSSCSSL